MKRVQRYVWAWQRARRWQGKRWVIELSPYDWWREYVALSEYLDRQRRVAEWEALKLWWSCREKHEYQRVRELCGNELARALAKWHKTDRYKLNKTRYQRKYTY